MLATERARGHAGATTAIGSATPGRMQWNRPMGLIMTTIEPRTCEIPLDQLEGVEEAAFKMLGMDREKVMDQFDDIYEDTLEKCLETIECKGMYKSFAVESIDNGVVALEGGVVFESKVLAEVLHRANEIVLYAVAAHGYEELSANPENDMFEDMFYNAWGVGYSMASHRWIKAAIAEHAREAGLYTGRGWTPGEDDLELGLQTTLFEVLDPSQVGIVRRETGLMSPIMSVTGFMGISSDPAIAQDGSERSESH